MNTDTGSYRFRRTAAKMAKANMNLPASDALLEVLTRSHPNQRLNRTTPTLRKVRESEINTTTLRKMHSPLL